MSILCGGIKIFNGKSQGGEELSNHYNYLSKKFNIAIRTESHCLNGV